MSHKNSVLEIGSHTGRLTRKLAPRVDSLITLDRQVFENRADCQSICADAEQLPFNHENFDWIISGGSFQWFENEAKALDEMYKLVKPGGLLSFSQFTQGSMQPLAQEMQSLGEGSRLLELKSETELGSIIASSKWESLVFERLEGSDWFSNFSESLKFLRNIGATKVEQSPPLKRSVWKALCQKMEASKRAQGYPVFWKATVVALRKPA